MSQRRNREVTALPVSAPAHKISDKSARIWESYYAPMQGAAQALNAAIGNTQNILAKIILDMEGFSHTTHLFDMEKLEIVPRPQE